MARPLVVCNEAVAAATLVSLCLSLRTIFVAPSTKARSSAWSIRSIELLSTIAKRTSSPRFPAPIKGARELREVPAVPDSSRRGNRGNLSS
jgi:hypothetical protein